MNASPMERAAALGGVAFTVLGLAGTGVGGLLPATDAGADEIRRYLADHHGVFGVGAVLNGLGFLALAVFFAWVDRRLRADDEGTIVPTVALAAGVVTVGLALLGVVFQGLLARHSTGLDDSSLLLTYRTWNLIFFDGPVIPQALFLTAVGARVLRTGVFPRWLGVVGVLSGIVGGIEVASEFGTGHIAPAALGFGSFLTACLFFCGVGVASVIRGNEVPSTRTAPAA